MTTALESVEVVGGGEQLSLFDYDTIAKADRDFVRGRTDKIRFLCRRTARDIVDIGRHLIEVRDRLAGKFLHWLQSEFQWGEQTGLRFIRVAERFPDLPPNADLEARALYLLAGPSTPTAASDEAISRATSGERVTLDTARQIRDSHRPKQKRLSLDTPAVDSGLTGRILAGLPESDRREVLDAREIEEEADRLREQAEELQLPDDRTRQLTRVWNNYRKARQAASMMGEEGVALVRHAEEGMRMAEELLPELRQR